MTYNVNSVTIEISGLLWHAKYFANYPGIIKVYVFLLVGYMMMVRFILLFIFGK